MYHDVVAAEGRDGVGFPGPVAGVYKLEPATFSAHLDALRATGTRVGLYGQTPRAMLTFDDGGASSMWIASELERHGFRGAFFVVTSRLGTPGFIDGDGVRELVERGHAVGSHSHTHPSYMARLDAQALAAEWCTSFEALGEILGEAPRGAAVPGGSVSAEVIRQAARAGYTHVFTSTPRASIARRAGIDILGRYTMWAVDPPRRAAAFAAGRRLPRARRWLGWQLKSGAKRASPRIYEAARGARAGHAEVRNETSRSL